MQLRMRDPKRKLRVVEFFPLTMCKFCTTFVPVTHNNPPEAEVNEAPRPNRAGRHGDYRHVRAVIAATVHDAIRRESIDRGIPMESLYPEVLAAGIEAIRGKAKAKKRKAATSA